MSCKLLVSKAGLRGLLSEKRAVVGERERAKYEYTCCHPAM